MRAGAFDAFVAAAGAVVTGYRIESAQGGKFYYRSVGIVLVVTKFPYFLHAYVAQKSAKIERLKK